MLNSDIFLFLKKKTLQAREVLKDSNGNDPLTVTTAEVTITIKDINDEAPTFNYREYSIEIPENVPEGTPLPHLDMTVNDPDVVSWVVSMATLNSFKKKKLEQFYKSFELFRVQIRCSAFVWKMYLGRSK